MKSLLISILSILGIPLFGYAIGRMWIRDRDVSLFATALADLSIAACVGGLVLFSVVLIGAAICRGNRHRLAALFEPLIKILNVALPLLILAQGAISLLSLYVLIVTSEAFVFVVPLLLIGIGAVYGAIAIFQARSALSQPAEISGIGVAAAREAQPGLWRFVDDIANRSGARVPGQIVLGLEPNFFASAAAVTIFPEGTRFTGETLYLGLPMLRGVSQAEFAAILGHELGHFMGEDTIFTLRFLPVYRGLHQALQSLSDRKGWQLFALLPAMVVLGSALSRFAKAERAISRDREFEADRVGAKVASRQALVASLLKAALIGRLWPSMNQVAIERLNKGEAFINMSEALVQECVKLTSEASPQEIVAEIGRQHQAHPIDSHPTTAERAAALEVDLAPDLLRFEANAPRAIAIITGHIEIERTLSRSYQRWLIERGLAKLPAEA